MTPPEKIGRQGPWQDRSIRQRPWADHRRFHAADRPRRALNEGWRIRAHAHDRCDHM